MNPTTKFIIRAVIGLIGAFFLTRVFLKTTEIGWTIGLAVLLVLLAYILEKVRREKKPGNKP
jgi:FtsH-binding integral membrane protein